jgi:hypothetical protein
MFTTDGTTRLTSGAKLGRAATGTWALDTVQPHSMIAKASQIGRIMNGHPSEGG